MSIDWSQKETPASRAAAARGGMVLSRAQFAIRAMMAGIITSEEAEEWAAGNGLPTLIAGVIAQLPAGQARARARIEAKAAADVHRTHPLAAGMAAALGLTDAQVDALFSEAPA